MAWQRLYSFASPPSSSSPLPKHAANCTAQCWHAHAAIGVFFTPTRMLLSAQAVQAATSSVIVTPLQLCAFASQLGGSCCLAASHLRDAQPPFGQSLPMFVRVLQALTNTQQLDSTSLVRRFMGAS
jgi:hypothetical protein